MIVQLFVKHKRTNCEIWHIGHADDKELLFLFVCAIFLSECHFFIHTLFLPFSLSLFLSCSLIPFVCLSFWPSFFLLFLV